jgi:hypothetical protein
VNNDIEVNMEENGGKTRYYDLPKPDLNLLEKLLKQYIISDDPDTDETFMLVMEICKLVPQTLNDLIEFKEMKPWQHEVMKACYAINERAKKNGGSELREINKIIYYAQRRKNQLLKDK